MDSGLITADSGYSGFIPEFMENLAQERSLIPVAIVVWEKVGSFRENVADNCVISPA